METQKAARNGLGSPASTHAESNGFAGIVSARTGANAAVFHSPGQKGRGRAPLVPSGDPMPSSAKIPPRENPGGRVG